ERARVVGVVAHQGGHVEIDRQPRLPVLDQVAKAVVGVLAGAVAGDLPHRPEAAAIHRRIGAAREWILSRFTDLLVRRRVVGPIGPLDRNTGQGLVLRLELGPLLHGLVPFPYRSRSSMIRLALDSVRGMVPSAASSTRGRTPSLACNRSRTVFSNAFASTPLVYSALTSSSSIACVREMMTRNSPPNPGIARRHSSIALG